MGMKVRVSRSVLIGIQRISAEVAPREACGLLFGAPDRITDWQAVENVAEEPERHFEIDPGRCSQRSVPSAPAGRKIAGYWHSHPSGDATPSVTDAAMAQPDGKLWLIVAQGESETLWRAEDRGPLHGRFAPVELILA
jgi:proteasome lid subunit RPN8/RPN11